LGTHINVINLLKRLQNENQNPLCLELETDDNQELMRKYFLNYRGGDPENARGLRLTHSGLMTMKCFFKCYDIELPGDYKSKPRHILYLDRNCRMPWHLYENHLQLFEEEMAFRAKLVGDLDLLVSSFQRD
jgi:hypothetical protein